LGSGSSRDGLYPFLEEFSGLRSILICSLSSCYRLHFGLGTVKLRDLKRLDYLKATPMTRVNRPYVGIPTFLRSRHELRVDAFKAMIAVLGVPFDEGSLTGTLSLQSTWPAGDWRGTYFVPENLRTSVEHADALKPFVPAGSNMAEMALRFILNNRDVATIIPGMRKIKNVEANIVASDKGPLPAALHAELRKHRWVRQPTAWSQ